MDVIHPAAAFAIVFILAFVTACVFCVIPSFFVRLHLFKKAAFTHKVGEAVVPNEFGVSTSEEVPLAEEPCVENDLHVVDFEGSMSVSPDAVSAAPEAAQLPTPSIGLPSIGLREVAHLTGDAEVPPLPVYQAWDEEPRLREVPLVRVPRSWRGRAHPVQDPQPRLSPEVPASHTDVNIDNFLAGVFGDWEEMEEKTH